MKPERKRRREYASAGRLRRSLFVLLLALGIAAVAIEIAAVPAAAGNLQKACAADIEQWCGDVKPGGGRVLRCLRSRAEDLSDACRAVIAPPRGGGLAHLCAEDAGRHCAELEFGTAAMYRCLDAHAAVLSDACRDRLAAIRAAREVARLRRKLPACQPDLHHLCADVRAGRGRLQRCLEENREALSEPCLAQLRQLAWDRLKRRRRKPGEPFSPIQPLSACRTHPR